MAGGRCPSSGAEGTCEITRGRSPCPAAASTKASRPGRRRSGRSPRRSACRVGRLVPLGAGELDLRGGLELLGGALRRPPSGPCGPVRARAKRARGRPADSARNAPRRKRLAGVGRPLALPLPRPRGERGLGPDRANRRRPGAEAPSSAGSRPPTRKAQGGSRRKPTSSPRSWRSSGFQLAQSAQGQPQEAAEDEHGRRVGSDEVDHRAGSGSRCVATSWSGRERHLLRLVGERLDPVTDGDHHAAPGTACRPSSPGT